jgi:hypothetical protein
MARTKANQPLLDELTPEQRKAVLNGSDALATLHDYSRKSFDLWMLVAKGVAPLAALADRLTSRKARQNLLKDNGYGSLHSTMVSRLVHMANFEAEIRNWREGLKPKDYDAWQSPTSICNRCPAIKAALGRDRPRPVRPKPEPKPNSDAQAARIAELEEELASAKAQPMEQAQEPEEQARAAFNILKAVLRGMEPEKQAVAARNLRSLADEIAPPKPSKPKPASKKGRKDAQRPIAAGANQYEAIAALYTPKGYTIEYRKNLTGMHYGKRQLNHNGSSPGSAGEAAKV